MTFTWIDILGGMQSNVEYGLFYQLLISHVAQRRSHDPLIHCAVIALNAGCSVAGLLYVLVLFLLTLKVYFS